MKEIRTEVWHEIGMTCPIDYDYMGETEAVTDRGETRYIQVCHGVCGSYYAVSKLSMKDSGYPGEGFCELYSTASAEDGFPSDEAYEAWLVEDGDALERMRWKAEGSVYFPLFMKIEYLLDKLAAEVAEGKHPDEPLFHWFDREGREYRDGYCVDEFNAALEASGSPAMDFTGFAPGAVADLVSLLGRAKGFSLSRHRPWEAGK